MSGVRCQVSGVRRQVSGVRCQVSGVRCQVSGEKSEIKTHLLQKAVMHRSDVDEGVWVGGICSEDT